MKLNYSSQGLSEILEESDREDFEHPRRQLAKLNNLEFLNQYVHLSALSQISQQYQHLLSAPINPNYQRFSFNHQEAARRSLNELQQNLHKIERAQQAVLSKDELKTLAAKKMQQIQSRQRLSTSRRQKRDQYYELLKTSRRFNSQRLEKSSFYNQSIERVDSVIKLENLQSPIKDISTQQTIQDLFLRLQKAGQQRDIIKKQWYSWGEKAGRQEKTALIDSWAKTHRFLKQLLEEALSKISEQVGSPQIFRQLRIESTSILFGKRDKSRRQKTLGSTGILNPPSPEQTKLIVRFSQWFNKLLLDERQLQFIKSQHQHLKRV